MLCIFSQKNARMVFTTPTFIVEPENISAFFIAEKGTLPKSALYPQGKEKAPALLLNR